MQKAKGSALLLSMFLKKERREHACVLWSQGVSAGAPETAFTTCALLHLLNLKLYACITYVTTTHTKGVSRKLVLIQKSALQFTVFC